ncbi:MAG: hypothetical protein B6D58_06940 [candidate division Zixibacteria bacterium 4484_95]|nr:MAG: hypothetical protein B6D58_06940 [candidate division Zixibacteria bacterium 4484_95]
MNFYDLIKGHRSVRHFSGRPVAKEKIDRVIQAGLCVPLGADKAPLKLIVVYERETKQKIRLEAEKIERAFKRGAGGNNDSHSSKSSICKSNWKMPFLEEAPCLIIVCGQSGQPYQAASTWLALGNMMLKANEEGLGSLCYSPTLNTFLRKILNIHPQFIPVAIMPLGYCAEGLFPRMPPEEEKVFKNILNGRFKWR